MIVSEIRGWSVWSCKADPAAEPETLLAAMNSAGTDRYESDGAAQVHDLLRGLGAISAEALENGRAADCAWVGESDWAYRAVFAMPGGKGPHFLHCKGLDTVADIFLNGKHLGRSVSMYLPFRMDVSEYLRGENELTLCFHRHDKMAAYYKEAAAAEERLDMPSDGMSLLRRMHDYGHNAAKNHGYKPIGPFDKVLLESVGSAELSDVSVEARLNTAMTSAGITVALTGRRYDGAALAAKVTLTDPAGKTLAVLTPEVRRGEGGFEATAFATVENPELWWPKNYGAHPLYRMDAVLMADGEVAGELSRPFGIRSLTKYGNMIFACNGVPIRFWGADIAPVWGPSNTFNPDYTFELIERVDLLGINAVRVWGPSQPYPDEFYDQFDRRGILVWQDFPTGGSKLPETTEQRRLYRDEAAHMVRRLRHHPCIYLWCGGNENIYMSELYGEDISSGFDILLYDFKDVVAALDPARYYHASCPYEGPYTNDPMNADSHGSRAFRAFCPGEQYGAFFSENIRVYPPQYKSFRRWLGEESLWENGYVDRKTFGCVKPMPATWQELCGNHGEEKFGPIWDYYAATNVHELIYKFTAAAGQDLYQMYARSRRGNPAHKAHEGQFCRGQVIWKLNDPWPAFYCAFIDYYLEPSLAYYAAKRAVRPVWIDFEVADHIYLWGVNDTREAVAASLELTFYNMEDEKIVKRDVLPVSIAPGTSGILLNLDSYGSVFWFTLLHARLVGADGGTLAVTNQFVTKENMLPFHDAKLAVKLDGDLLTVTTDKFARSVELSAGEDGCAFGWVFEDNFFDLFPFEEKRVRVQKRGDGGVIRAKAQYSGHVTTVTV